MPLSTTLQRGLAAGAMLAAFGAGAAQAQSQCGASYRIQPGDTLYQVSQQCRVALSRIMQLNPSLGNPRDIEVGTRLSLVAGEGDQAAPAPQPRSEYRVREGDTFYSIAQTLGVSLLELIQENDEVNPFSMAVGDILDVPGAAPGASVSISPRYGPPDARVTVEAANLRPADYVTVGVGRRASEWEALRDVRVGEDGRITAEVGIPDWADPGDKLIYVVDTDRGMTLKSDVFTLREEQPAFVRYEGRVTEGAECPVLETPDGDSYALTSSSIPFTTGEYVEVRGTRAEMAYCMAGMTTLDVTGIEEVTPPDDMRGGEGLTLEGRIREGTECATLVTPDGDRYALTSESMSFTPGEYVEIEGRTSDISYCMEGQSTVSVNALREVSPPARDRDPARAGGQALTRAYVTGDWTAKGGDCRRPDFSVNTVPGGGLSVETALGGAPRTGRVLLGEAPALRFDPPGLTMPLETRGPDGLAVLAPAGGGTARLGDERIEGDGVVFLRCG
ncbi:LysM peptidoglycan-binding domain-containing protein [Aquicoccus sp. SCR17]|nr:LysM peptidoglycan-binding domain-containing protein [Carideicomes alvinocaridis]